MSTTHPDVTSTGADGPVVLTGTPVVPGVALGPVIRPHGAVQLPTDDAEPVAEADRARRRSGSPPPPRWSPAG